MEEVEEVEEEKVVVWSHRFPLKVFSFNLFLKRFWPEVTDHIGAVFRLSDHLIKLKSIQRALASPAPFLSAASKGELSQHRRKNPIPGGFRS